MLARVQWRKKAQGGVTHSNYGSSDSLPTILAISASSIRKQGEIKTYSNGDSVQWNVSYSALEHFDRMLARAW